MSWPRELTRIAGILSDDEGGPLIEALTKVIAGLAADYADVRYEENEKTLIRYEGKVLREVSAASTRGGHLRAYASGGKAIASFSRLEDAHSLAQTTSASARLAAGHRDRPLRLATAPVERGSFPASPKNDPRRLSLREKQGLVEHYNSLVLQEPRVATTIAQYDEFYSHRHFTNSEGTAVEYELLIVNITGSIAVKRKDLVQRVRFAYGGNDDLAGLLDRDDELRERVARACELLEAEPVKAGLFPVILDPDEAGVFIHEAFGHLSEADGIQNNPSFRARLELGTPLGRPILSVSDDPALLDRPGGCVIDDEGVRARKTRLVTNGILAGRLHSRETAAEFGEPLSGNMRAVDAPYTPIVRMSNILIEPGSSTFAEMVASIDDGYYLVGAKGGQTAGDQFSFGAMWGFRIRGGRLGRMVRDVNMSGELFSTLRGISMVGDDLHFAESGGCGKGGGGPIQMNRKSGKGAPHIKIDRVTLGGTR